jgi:hypothetical protein
VNRVNDSTVPSSHIRTRSRMRFRLPGEGSGAEYLLLASLSAGRTIERSTVPPVLSLTRSQNSHS